MIPALLPPVGVALADPVAAATVAEALALRGLRTCAPNEREFVDLDVLVADPASWLAASRGLQNTASRGLVYVARSLPEAVRTRWRLAKQVDAGAAPAGALGLREELRFASGRRAIWFIDDDPRRFGRDGLWGRFVADHAASDTVAFGSLVPESPKGGAGGMVQGWLEDVVKPAIQHKTPLVVVVDHSWKGHFEGNGLGWCRTLRQVLQHAIVLAASVKAAPIEDNDDAHDVLIIEAGETLAAPALRQLTEAIERARPPLSLRSAPVWFGTFLTRDEALARRLGALESAPKPVVTLLGPQGTGKEELARWWHTSHRSQGPYVSAAGGNLPDDDKGISELFGHVPGAFTGAMRAKPGLVRDAKGGTLFLDEFHDVKAANQERLKRALDPGVGTPLGGGVEYTIDTHWVFASSDLGILDEGSPLNADLAGRLRSMGETVALPALARRPADIGLLARWFLVKEGHCGRISREAEELLMAQPWPENVRGLKGAMDACRRACVDPTIRIEVTHLPASARTGGFAWRTSCPPVRRRALARPAAFAAMLLQDDDEFARFAVDGPPIDDDTDEQRILDWLRSNAPPVRNATPIATARPQEEDDEVWVAFLAREFGEGKGMAREAAAGRALAGKRFSDPKFHLKILALQPPRRPVSLRAARWKSLRAAFVQEWQHLKPGTAEESSQRILSRMLHTAGS